ncbi:tetratricopeptide repeat protein [Actinoplanes subglobosus]|uniref:Tetratricopeptide repeat protein n=1 Tax=Actinoplanes subglobosus TaxID=1547892 RepID=A0ABV8IV94_9ACTN
MVLRVAALLDPNGIPTEFFNTPAALGHYRKQRGAGVDPEDAADTIRTLHRYGLADTTRDPDTGITLMRVHALVQRVAAEAAPSRDRRESTFCAADALVQLWPHIENNHATAHLGHLLRANTAALAVAGGEHLWQLRTGTPAVHPVLVRAGDSLGQIGQVAAARDYFRQLSAEAARRLGTGHRGALMTRSKFAYWTGKAGNPTGAATALEQLLADYARMFGHGHRFVLDIRYGLARWTGEAGDAAVAAATFEQLLPVYVRMFGTDHRRTLAARHGLARWQGEAGDPVAAADAFEQLLDDRLRVLGPDHPDTLATVHQLGHWRGRVDTHAHPPTAIPR